MAYHLGKLGQEKIKGNTLEYYIDNLKEVREKTLLEFRKRDDSWLFEQQTAFWGREAA